MNTQKIIIAIIVAIALVITGFFLSSRGKPYGFAPFNVHKFIALGFVIFLGVNIFQVSKLNPLTPAQITLVVVTGLLFAFTIVIGGLLDTDLKLPEMVKNSHKITPWLSLASTAITLFLLNKR